MKTNLLTVLTIDDNLIRLIEQSIIDVIIDKLKLDIDNINYYFCTTTFLRLEDRLLHFKVSVKEKKLTIKLLDVIN